MEQIKNLIPLQSLSMENLLESYKHIELTKEEEQYAILQAKKKKDSELRTTAYWAEVKKEASYPVYKAEELNALILKEANKTIPNFKLDEFNEEIIFDLCCYFTSDERFEKDGKSLSKGLFLFGGVGCGKTSLLNLFRSNQLASYIIVSCDELSKEYQQGGSEEIEKYYGLIATSNRKKYFGQEQLGICFDDLGTEDIQKHFGNQANVMSSIILARYSRKELLKNKTHITTNLSSTQIEEMYGTRVKSRMREMFSQIEFHEKCPDRRN